MDKLKDLKEELEEITKTHRFSKYFILVMDVNDEPILHTNMESYGFAYQKDGAFKMLAKLGPQAMFPMFGNFLKGKMGMK